MGHREGQVIEVLFDADQPLSPTHWAEPVTPEPWRHIPIPITLPTRRFSTASTSSSISSCASPLLLSPTLPPSPTISAWDAARKTSPRPTLAFIPHARGLDAAALWLAGVPSAEADVRKERDLAAKQSAREVRLAQQALGPRANVPREVATLEWMAKTAEVTEGMQIQRLKEKISEAEAQRRAQSGRGGFFRGIRSRFT